jgi:hypothetical protein
MAKTKKAPSNIQHRTSDKMVFVVNLETFQGRIELVGTVARNYNEALRYFVKADLNGTIDGTRVATASEAASFLAGRIRKA